MFLEGLSGALYYFTDPNFLMWILGGIIVGLVIGILPGINGTSALAIFLPFTFVLRADQALPFMIAVLASNYTGGVLAAALLGIPGESGNIVACLDGYPMTQKGESGRSLGISLMSSALGGTFSAFLALLMIPVVLIVILSLQSAEMVFIILLGIICIGELSAGAMTKGLISGGVGLMISFIGPVAQTGEQRFTFGSIYLYNGIPLLPVVLGLFAMPVLLDLMMQGGAIAKVQAVTGGTKNVIQAAKDIWHSRWTFIRGTVIGYIIGLIPGVGAGTATWAAYAQAKATSKHPEEFGKGSPEGLVAANCSVNSSEAGDLLCTLALGIPGSAGMALIMGAMMMTGITPGPEVLTTHLSLSLALIYIVVAGHVIGAIICLLLVRQLAMVVNTPGRILISLVIPLVVVGTFAPNEEILDLVTLFIFTVIGIAMLEFGYSRPALFLGYILGILFEHYWSLSYQIGGWLFFAERPISMVLIIIIALILTYRPMKRLFGLLRPKGTHN